jgi:hypothetical protein
MRIEEIGPFQVALGLDWQERTAQSDIETMVDVFAGRNQVEAGSVRFVKCSSEAGEVVGLGDAEGAGRGIVSLAAAVAHHGDGIYLMVIGNSLDVWMCMIRDGLVIREQIIQRTAIRATVDMANGLPGKARKVYAGSGAGVQGDELFNPEAVLVAANLKSITMERIKVATGARRRFLLVMVIFLAGGLGAAYYRHTHRPPNPAKLRAQAIAAYISSSISTIGVLPRTSQWMFNALASARRLLVPFAGGMSLGEIQCSPTLCTAAYLPPKTGAPYSPLALKALFGRHYSLKAMNGQSSVVVSWRVPGRNRLYTINASFLSNPPGPPADRVDPLSNWTGMLPLGMPGAKLYGATRSSTMTGGAAYGFPAIHYQQVSVEGDEYLDDGVMRQAAADFRLADFKAIQINWSPGYVGNPGWRIAVARVTR